MQSTPIYTCVDDYPIPTEMPCRNCKIVKLISEFPSRYRSTCNLCLEKYSGPDPKICEICNNPKSPNDFISESSSRCKSCLDGQKKLLTQIRRTMSIPLDEYGKENMDSLMIPGTNFMLKRLTNLLDVSCIKYDKNRNTKDLENVIETILKLKWLAFLVKDYKENKALNAPKITTKPNQTLSDCNQYLDALEYVYIITSPDRVPQSFKIGKHTGSINKLISRYKTYFPLVEIVRLYQVNKSILHESNLHKKLVLNRIENSEWFLIDRDKLCRIADRYFAELPIPETIA